MLDEWCGEDVELISCDLVGFLFALESGGDEAVHIANGWMVILDTFDLEGKNGSLAKCVQSAKAACFLFEFSLKSCAVSLGSPKSWHRAEMRCAHWHRLS
ncbi:unnamed protein product [Microthlaspi erraticum]|uniref:Uncharacterized protein n=1 Tax=Microthlaspi erraticum TaxID=1685480 RepID=A0A6D2JFC4_9BRAS|nr:unnamed protein product [Microthlaspi erraticum]